jgi:hypothetical protein
MNIQNSMPFLRVFVVKYSFSLGGKYRFEQQKNHGHKEETEIGGQYDGARVGRSTAAL